MANETYQIDRVNGSFTLVPVLTGPGATLSQNTISLTPGTVTFTIAPGTSDADARSLTFTDSIVMPSVFSGDGVDVTPMTVGLTNGQFIFTCTDALAAGAPSVSGNFNVPIQLTLGTITTFTLHDPTMIFNPPE